jgi:putative PIG3 family NAD(P)H quinone oxidoreductase
MAVIDVKDGKGPASALFSIELQVPVPGDGQVLIRVDAAGINRPDVFQRMGFYPPPPGAPATLGLEVAGEIVVASGRWKVGDRVCALLGGGGYAEYAVADAMHVLPHPAGLDATSAAALPETVFTVFANVFEDGHLKSGQTLLVHGANSGIGTTAIQMAKAAGARVIATARGAEKTKAALGLGADVAIDTNTDDFAEIAKADGGVDVVLDMVGGDFFARNLDALRPHGRIVYIAGLAGMEITVPIMAMMAKQAIITGSTLRARTSEEKSALAQRVEEVVWPWIAQGQVRPQIDSTFPLAEAAKAHERMEAGSHSGKIVLTVGADANGR